MNFGGNDYNNNISLPIINSTQSQNGNARNDQSYLYNINTNNNQNMSYLQRRTETPNDQSYNYIMSEIKNMKQLIKATYEGQTEIQGKIIEYNRIISQQENIIRLNNIKLSEHDNKLTDILLSFDNYLKLHDKTTKITNEVQKRLDNTVSISDYSEFKTNYYSTKTITDNQIASLYHTNEESQMKLVETTYENKRLQEYIIDKVTNVENKLSHSILDYQRNSSKIQEAQYQSINGQFNHIMSLIQLMESKINEEGQYKKIILEKFQGEIYNLSKLFDDKFGLLEKSQLETEKNLICLNKDYVGTFQELLSNQKDKNDIELNSLRSLVDGGLAKNKFYFEENMNSIKERINKLSSGIEEQKTTFADLELFVKDSIKSVNETVENTNKSELDTKSKLETINNVLNTYIKESMENITKMHQQSNKELSDKIQKEIIELEQNQKNQADYNAKKLTDLNEKTTQITTTLQLLSQVNNQVKEDSGDSKDIDSLTIKLYDFQQKLTEIEANLKKEVNGKIDELIPKNKIETQILLDSINDRIDKIIKVLKNDLKNQYVGFQSTIEGSLQGLIIESENKIHNYYTKEINILQEAIETMTLKYGNSPSN